MTIELTPEQQRALDANGTGPPVVIDPRTGSRFWLITESELQAYIQWLDSYDEEQYAFRRMAEKNLGSRLERDQ